MTHDTFKLIAKTARELRTEAATYTLLDAYARNQCATYPVDSALFMELWPYGNPPGYVLTRYSAGNMNVHTHTVAYDMADGASNTHAPGPWTCSLAGTDAGKVCTMGDNEQLIATVEIGFSKEDKANARLIAAAPETKRQRDELLAALQALVTHRTGAGTAAQIHQHYEAARAAIAKAEGGAA
jgi:hypothetical protein